MLRLALADGLRDQPQVRRVVGAGPGHDHLRDLPSAGRRPGVAVVLDRDRRRLARLHAPVEQEDGEQRAHDRALGTHHRVHPFPDARALLEVPRVHEVHAAGVGDAPVHDDDLAVQAQVDAAEGDAPGIDGERHLQVDALRAHARRPIGLEELLAAERVEQQPHPHAPGRRPGERVRHLVGRAARVPDVELHLDAGDGAVHVGDDLAQDRPRPRRAGGTTSAP